MRISRVSEGEEIGAGESDKIINDHSHEYQTASELFELMSRNHNFDADDDDSLSHRGLVVLYKNIDKGIKLISEAAEFKLQKPNQYVETVIYEDLESDDSDVYDVHNTEELETLLSVNKERIDFFSSQPSFEKKLCEKFSGIDIKSSSLTTDYNKNFVFQDPYIKHQLDTFNIAFNQREESLVPPSLLDYICCQRLDDNYNFYMDNVIRYVKHTIEQLKRISNGEYLTDKTKEKWKEVDNTEINKSNKMLATSASIPLHVECKTNRYASTWDDLVHSELDVRYLSKILKKKIIIEVPKLTSTSFKLFTKRCADNLIVSCKNEKQHVIKDEKKENVPRVDLVFRLEQSQSGHMINNINSVMVVQIPPIVVDDCAKAILPLSYEEIENVKDTDERIKITELCKNEEDVNYYSDANSTTDDVTESKDTYSGDLETVCDSLVDTNDYPNSENELQISKNQSESSNSAEILRNYLNTEPFNHQESCFNIGLQDGLRLTMQMLNTQVSLPEESSEDISVATVNSINKKKSPTRVRIKSPYENKSYILEEKKRKRLLEIREKREKKKLAFGDRCKINKHKYPKGVLMPQPSNSVTKLSITNKSFYNSIYGETSAIENKQTKRKNRMINKDLIPEVPLEQICSESESQFLTSERDSRKSINRSYYLDDAVTEVMYMDMKKKDNTDVKACSASTSAVSSDFQDNLKLLSQMIGHSAMDLTEEDVTSEGTSKLNEIINISDKIDLKMIENVHTPQSVENKAPVNSPTKASNNKSDYKKSTSSVECRKSIDKIYGLVRKIGKDINGVKVQLKNKSVLSINTIQGHESSTIQGSDSGTSVKHRLPSSNPSCFSFERTNDTKIKKLNVKKNQSSVETKVVISSKSQSLKSDTDKSKKNKKVQLITPKSEDNPLKTISQLLYDFNNVQKAKPKTVETKVIKKSEQSFDVKNSSRHIHVRRRSRLDQHLKDTEFSEQSSGIATPHKQKQIFEIIKPHQTQTLFEKDKKKKVTVDIIDEAKEARGVAIRGPSKFSSRLNSLAQPKKSYVQAHSEECQTKYGNNLMSDRLQRLATAQYSIERSMGFANSKNRIKKSGAEGSSSVLVKPPPAITAIATSVQRSSTTSPKRKFSLSMSPYKYNNEQQTPETLKKMMAVETYVKGHYGHTSLLTHIKQAQAEMLQNGHMSRVPLLPNDFDLISVTSTNTAEESNELGNKLHHIIDNMINTNTTALTVLPKCVEVNSKSKNTDESLTDSARKERISQHSDFTVDVFQDKNIITAVAGDDDKVVTQEQTSKCDQTEISIFTNELAKLESALYRQLSDGVFQKRLRIKNLTLTPKQSIKSPILLQSGDTGSILLKSSLSQNLKTSSHDKLVDIKALPVLSKSDLDWSFAKFPMQITTIGYVFPKYSIINLKSDSIIHLPRDDLKQTSKIRMVKNIEDRIIKCSDTNECSQIDQPKVEIDQFIQVNAREESITKENKTTEIDDFIKSDLEVKREFVEQHIIKEELEPLETIKKDSMDHTSSLDMLVGLLNEIQKITTCQTHITNSDSSKQSKDFETILNDAAAPDKYSDNTNKREMLGQSESNINICTYYQSNNRGHESCNTIKDIRTYEAIYEDKQVHADFNERETISRFTEVPSIYPITINSSTIVTNSLIGVLSQSSSQSLFSSYLESKSVYSKHSFTSKKLIIELPQAIHKSSHQFLVPYEKFQVKAIDFDVTTPLEQEKIELVDVKTCYKNVKFKSGYEHFDPSFKMKRDILVTVYSILVFTVFAALTFPEIMYHV